MVFGHTIFDDFEGIDIDLFAGKEKILTNLFEKASDGITSRINNTKSALKDAPENLSKTKIMSLVETTEKGWEGFQRCPQAPFMGQSAVCNLAIVEAVVAEFEKTGEIPELLDNEAMKQAARKILPEIVSEFRAELG